MKSGFLIYFLLCTLSFCYTNVLRGQTLTLQEAAKSLQANPPVTGDSLLRKNCFDLLDARCMDPNASSDPDIAQFYNEMTRNIAADIDLPSSALAVVFKTYNHGFIVKMQDLTIGFDLVRGMSSWNMLSDKILKQIDVAMVTHEHSDHYDINVLNRIQQNGGTIIIPSEMSYPGAIKLAPEDSVVIKGVTIKAYDGVHGDTPVRIYEVYSPLGIRILHSGDNQASFTLPDVKDIDILLLNSWVNEGDGAGSNVVGMYNCLQKLKPKCMIPGHCNELSHDPAARYPYDSVYKLTQQDLPSKVVVMAGGEKFIYKPNEVLPIHKTSSPPVIDGFWDTSWAFVPRVSMTVSLLEAPSDWFDLYSSFQALWTPDELYFYLSVNDDTLRTENADMWNNDVAEFYFDGDNSKNSAITGYDENDTRMGFEYMDGSLNTTNSEYAYQETSTGYNLEIGIPFTDLKFVPSLGKLIGFDVQVTDNDTGTQNSIVRWWSDSENSPTDPSLFGTAKLVEPELSGIKDVYYTSSDVQIDAEMDNAWVGKEYDQANHIVLGEEYLYSPADAQLEWNTLWNENYLYFWFDVKDDTLLSDGGDEYYQDDCIEVWLDGDNNKSSSLDGINDYCFQFRYNQVSVVDTVKQSIGPTVDISVIKQAAKFTENGFILEVAIPMTILGVEAYDNSLIGFDLDYNDDDNPGDRDSKLKTYAQSDEAWQYPELWGTARLTGSGRVKREDPPVSNISDKVLGGTVSIFPNPCHDQLNISMTDLETPVVYIDITDTRGRRLQSFANSNADHIGSVIPIDISQLENGIYFVKVKGEGKSCVRKFVKYD